MKNSVLIFTISIFLLASCKKTLENNGEVVAEAYGNKLYSSELKMVLSDNTTSEDSVFIANEYIRVWLGKQVLLNEAESVLSAEEKDKSKQVEEYKNDLLVYEVLNKLALDQLDSSFSNIELEEYYNENIEEFDLYQNVLKIEFYKVKAASKGLEKLWKDFKKDFASAYQTLSELAKDGGNSYTDKNTWVYFDDILKEIPINTYNQEHYLNNNKFIQVKEGAFVYFIHIKDFKIRSNTSPFEMEKENIKKILRMKRQQELVKSIETKLIEKAYSSNKIIKY